VAQDENLHSLCYIFPCVTVAVLWLRVFHADAAATTVIAGDTQNTRNNHVGTLRTDTNSTTTITGSKARSSNTGSMTESS